VTEINAYPWLDPASGATVSIDDIVTKIKSNKEYTVHVGTDSHRVKGTKNSHTFATVICMYQQGRGADYYFRRITKDSKYSSLRQRIMEEVEHSVDVSIDLTKHIPDRKIVVHADVNSDSRYNTFNFLSQISSWVSAAGFKFHCKPDAWASSGVADKHAK
jgi:predicted RNase H-related nuclease YkuK (DUF458 family)